MVTPLRDAPLCGAPRPALITEGTVALRSLGAVVAHVGVLLLLHLQRRLDSLVGGRGLGRGLALELGLYTLGAAVNLVHIPRHLLAMLGHVPVLVALDVEGARLLVLTVLACGLLL